MVLFASDHAHFKMTVIGITMVSTYGLSGRSVITCIKNSIKDYKVNISSKSDIGIGTGDYQWNRKKSSTKTSSAGKLKDIR